MKLDPAVRDLCNMRMKSNFRRRILPVLIAACFCGDAILANPVGPQVVNGQVSFLTQGNLLSITNSPGSIINWQNFSINPSEITRFLQQNSSSSVLNRIIGQDPSQILGALQSNGRVFLINPNGILFGQGAQVDVNGLVASTLNISNADFLSGKHNFSAGDKASGIKNQGAITTPSGGQVYLIAPNIENSGIITSPKGDVVLAAGHSVQLVDSANPDMHVVVSAPDNQALNLGQIVAHSGKVGIYGALINQRGIVNADSAVVGENGKIVFKASKDTLLEAGSRTSATGAGKGGDIHVLGERVGLTGDAKVDASGEAGGGTVLVGGDYQGKNPNIRNAKQIYLSKDSEIKADAIQAGDGGRVIAWSDEVSRVYGAVSARGGDRSGNGGFVETSGKYLDMQGRVDTRAPHGATGTLLLDPTNIYIADNQGNATSAGMAGTDVSTGTGPTTFVAAGAVADSLLTVGILTGALAGSNVTVSTTNAPGTGTGNITVVDPVAWASTKDLTLSADGGITVSGAISSTGGSNIVSLDAGTGITVNAAISGGAGSTVKLRTASGDINQTAAIVAPALYAKADAGSVILNAAGNNVGTLAGYAGSATGSFNFTNSAALIIDTVATLPGVASNNRPINLTVSSGDLTIGASGVDAGSGIDANVTLVAASGAIVQSGVGVIAGNHLDANATSGIGHGTALLTQVASFGATNTGPNTDIGITNTGALTLNNITNSAGSGKIKIDNTGALDVSGTVEANTGSISLITNNALTLDAASAVRSLGAGAINLEAVNDITIDGPIHGDGGAGSTIKLSTSSGDIIQSTSAAQILATALYANATAGSVTLNNAANNVGTLAGYAGDVAGTGFSFVNSATLTIDAVTTAAGPPLTLNGVVTNNKPISIAVNSGNLTVSDTVNGVDAGTASVMLMADDLLTVSAGAKINGTGIIASADRMDLAANAGDINAGTGTLWLKPNSPGRNIDLGSVVDNTANTLELSTIELDSLAGSGILRIGALAAGNLHLSGPLAPAGHSGPLSLEAGGDVTQAATAIITRTDLAIKAKGDVTLGEGNSVTNLAAEIGDMTTPLNKNFLFKSAGALNLGGSIDGLTGISTFIDGIGYIPGSPNGVIALTSSGALTQDAGAILQGKAVYAKGATVNLQELNPTGVIAGEATGGSFKYKSNAPIFVTTVNGASGVQNTGIGGDIVLTSTTGGIGQDAPLSTKAVAGGGGFGLALDSVADVVLTDSGNNVTKIAANVASGGLTFTNSGALDISTVNGITGITTSGSLINVTAGGLMKVDEAVDAGTSSVLLEAPNIQIGKTGGLGTTIDGDFIKLRANQVAGTISTAGTTASIISGINGLILEADNMDFVTGGAPPPTFSATNNGIVYRAASDNTDINTSVLGLATYTAPYLVIGNDEVADANTTRDIVVDTVLNRGANGLVLLAGRSVSQTAVITAQHLAVRAGAVSGAAGSVTLNMGNQVDNLAARTHGGDFTFNNAAPLNITAPILPTVSGATVNITTGILSDNGNVTITSSAGDITISSAIAAGTGDVTLAAAAGAVSGGIVSGNNLTVSSSGMISLATAVSSLAADNSASSGDITISNSGSLTLNDVTQSFVGISTGNISINNVGDLTVGLGKVVSTDTGNISLVAHSPLTVDGSVISGTGMIFLEAGENGSVNDKLTINSTGTVSTSNNAIYLFAGDSITIQSGAVVNPGPSGSVTQSAFRNPVAPPPPPTVAECTATPTLAGCTAVLPTVDQCIATPTLAGCTAVLPTLSECTTTPTLAGCTTVLPTLSQCTVTPTLAGCSTVLPTLSECTTTPTLAGCTTVLPTLSQCATTPTLAGCSTVLPTLSECTTTPTLAGCTAVLPTLSQCATTPTLAGCTTVLPTLSQCTTTPTLAGCTTVLPTLSECTTTPTLAGCTTVLPTLNQCATTPTLAGCTTVLPTLSQCATTPTLAGCTAVLPTVSACTTTPTLAGCTAVLPTLSACTTSPTLAGCTTVLPTLSTCTTTPTLSGCSAVLPTLGECTTTPTLAGCTTVLPTTTTLTQTNVTTAQAINATVNTIIASTILASEPTVSINFVATSSATTTTSTTQTSSGTGTSSSGSSDKASDSKKDEKKKDDKKDTAGVDKPGAKKDDAAKKMYCN